MTTKNTEGLEHKQHCSARFICTHFSTHLSSLTIISAKELIGFEETIKCIFPVFSVKPNSPKRPCLSAMPVKLGSAKPCWRIRWFLHRNTKTVHSLSCQRVCATHSSGGQNRLSQWTRGEWRKLYPAFPAFSRKSYMDGGRQKWASDVCAVRKELYTLSAAFFHAS